MSYLGDTDTPHSLLTLATNPSTTDLEVREEVFTLLMELFRYFERETHTHTHTHAAGGGGGGGGGGGTGTQTLTQAQVGEREAVKLVQERLTYCLVKGLSDPDDRALEEVDTPADAETDTHTHPQRKRKKRGIRRRVMDFWDAPSEQGKEKH
jgi:hypothetical protein